MNIKGIFRFTLLAGIALVANAASADAAEYQLLYTFGSGVSPTSNLVRVKDELYGAVYGSPIEGGGITPGIIFGIDPATGAERTVHSFGAPGDAANPVGNLVSVGGRIYGAAASGGANGIGAIYELNPKHGTVKVLCSFTSGNARPQAGLREAGGTLFGTTTDGSSVFSFNTATGAYTTLFRLNHKDGLMPDTAVSDVDGILYGGTYFGGQRGAAGTLYSYDLETGLGTVLVNFKGRHGATPSSAPIKIGGELYGTASQGGASLGGVVYKYSPASSKEKVVYAFAGGADGKGPAGDLLDVGGIIYGTTVDGGSANSGTVYMLDPKTKIETVLYSFQSGADGATPNGDLIDVNGTMYGTTQGYGSTGLGTVFAITP